MPGPKCILEGLEGTGKTDSLWTVIEAGLKLFTVFLEPGMEVLGAPRKHRPLYTCAQGFHYKHISVASPSFQDLAEAANLLNKFDYKTLTQQGPSKRDKFTAYYELFATLSNLKCQRCGEVFGPADRLPYDQWCVAVDSLTSLSKAALYGHIGVKPGVHEGEYGIVMRNIETFIDKFGNDMPCMGILLAHVEGEPEATVAGAPVNTVATLGKKLAPKIPRPFSDVILAKRDGANFTWSTIEPGYKLKTRNLPFSGTIPPTFKPIIEAWRGAIKAAQEIEATGTLKTS